MSYSTIMVQVDLDHSNDARLRVAADLAERFDSRLIGIAAGDIQPLYYADGAAAAEFLEKDRAALEREIGEAEQKFRQMFKARSRPIEWRGALAQPADYVAREARAADLIIAGCHRERIDHAAPGRSRRAGATRRPAGSGRSAANHPDQPQDHGRRLEGHPRGPARDQRRPAAPAQGGAGCRGRNREGQIRTRRGEGADRGRRRLARPARHCHGLDRDQGTDRRAGQLDIIAQDEGADIIVAGAYGHTRFSEWVFGGVTRDALQGSASAAPC